MLSIQELQRIAGALSAEAFERQLGPFVLVQQPPDEVTQRKALQLGANQTAVAVSGKTDALSLLFAFDELMVATLPPLTSHDELTVGRLPDCDVVIDDPSVSKHHARLTWNQQTAIATVEDLGSSNGTMVNGKPLAQLMSTKDGDELSFGDARFCFLRTPTLYQRLTRGRFK